MAVLEGAVSGLLADVAEAVQKALHVTVKPIPWGGLGHYRVNHRCLLANTLAANARIFEARANSAAVLVVPTRLLIKTAQSAVGTAQDNSLDAFKCTAFTAVDTVNTVTPTVSRKRTTMGAAPGNMDIRGVTVAGAAAGMTGWTSTKDLGSFAQHPISVQAAVQWAYNLTDALDDVNGTHPFVFAQNEGFEIENRVLNVTTYGVMAYIDFSWAEVTLF